MRQRDNAVGYIRTSKEQQGISLEAQEEKIRAMCIVQEIVLSEVIHDESSGKDMDRPGVQRLVEMVKGRKVGAVIICKLDRLSRSVVDTCQFVSLCEDKGVQFVSMAETFDTSTAMGRFAMHMMAAFAEMERDRIGERTKDALQHLKKSGRRVGTVPYGYRAEVTEGLTKGGNPISELRIDEGEQAIIAEMKALRANGLTLRGVAKALNEHGHRTRNGTPWRFQYVDKILATEGKKTKGGSNA